MVIKGRSELLRRRFPDGDSAGPALAAIELDVRYQVLEARHGREALRIAEQHRGPIDLLVTDVVMPEMDGFELATTLRALRPSVRALYVSGYMADPKVRARMPREGAQLLQKPFAAGDLARKVGEVLESP